MLSFLAPKGLRAEVTGGIDLEQGIVLTGNRITIGSGPDDDLRLGAADVVHGHLTLERRADGSGWEYFASDRGITAVEGGNPRTGLLRAGLTIQLGRETQIEMVRAALPVTEYGADDSVPTTVPLPIALGILGGLAVVAFVAMTILGGGGGTSELSMQTTRLLTAPRAVEQALETCMSQTRQPSVWIAADDPGHRFWQVMALRDSDPTNANLALGELAADIRSILTDAHLLARAGRQLEASTTLHRLEYVLPLGDASCPILDASRFDFALLELRGNR